jgi:hypothetical protein
MYYVEVETKTEAYYISNIDDLTTLMIPTTRLVGPFKYRTDVENYIITNKISRVIEIE